LKGSSPGFLHLIGIRYWTASLLPAIAGTLLPLWLQPPNLSFNWLSAVEFLLAVCLTHAGFTSLLLWFESRSTKHTNRIPLMTAVFCLLAACLLGLHINSHLSLHEGVPGFIFIAFGLATFFVGILYTVPPFIFQHRMGGEIIIAEGLGMLPVMGAYLVQVGDLTRTVYLASMPLVVATGLWVWMNRLTHAPTDQKAGRRSMPLEFGLRFSGRVAVPALVLMFYAILVAAVWSGSIPPLSLLTLLAGGFAWKIISEAWNGYADPILMAAACKNAFIFHLLVCSIVAAAPLLTLLF